MSKIYLPDDIEDFCRACVPVGSRVTCDPAPTDTDQDVLCLLEDDEAFMSFENWLEKRGWTLEGEKYGTLSSEFSSWRKTICEPVETEYNLILTDKEEWFDKFLKATLECKKANAMTKKERVAIFDSIMGTKKKTMWQAMAQSMMNTKHADMQAINSLGNGHQVYNLGGFGLPAQVSIYDDAVAGQQGVFQW